MAIILSFAELAECWGVSPDTATRIALRDLPVVNLSGEGKKPIRGVELEAVEVYVERCTVADSDLAREIQREVNQHRARRIERAAKASTTARVAQLPELVRAKQEKKTKRTRRTSKGVQS